MQREFGKFVIWKPEKPPFKDRTDAGQQLGVRLIEKYGEALHNAVIIGCVRGGLAIAKGILDKLNAEGFHCELDIVIPRRLTSEQYPDASVGSMDEDGKVTFHKHLMEIFAVDGDSDFMQEQIRSAREQQNTRCNLFRKHLPAVELKGKTVILVDDGLASGSTAIAAHNSIKTKEPKRIIAALPVTSRDSIEFFRKTTQLSEENTLIYTYADIKSKQDYWDIEDFYGDFSKLTDEDTVQILQDYNNNDIADELGASESEPDSSTTVTFG